MLLRHSSRDATKSEPTHGDDCDAWDRDCDAWEGHAAGEGDAAAPPLPTRSTFMTPLLLLLLLLLPLLLLLVVFLVVGKQCPRGDTPSSYSLKLPVESNPGSIGGSYDRLHPPPPRCCAAVFLSGSTRIVIAAGIAGATDPQPPEEVGDDDCDDCDGELAYITIDRLAPPPLPQPRLG
mmetsp:Transcript_8361/g.17518  ORF Transcript_8361/g.17518 Transcript_8361/m.17518 type:complete len:178 (+) Transcript_8361:354-887(+)